MTDEPIVRIAARGDGITASGRYSPLAAPGDVLAAQQEVRAVHASSALIDYVQSLVEHSRRAPEFTNGLSPRAALSMRCLWGVENRDGGLHAIGGICRRPRQDDEAWLITRSHGPRALCFATANRRHSKSRCASVCSSMK